jgi:hypothetical protein
MKILSFLKTVILPATVWGIATGASFAQVSAPQVPSAPIVNNINQNDAVWIAVHGAAQVGSKFAYPAQISGAPGYSKVVPSTGFSLTFSQAQTDMILMPSGTLATGTLTTEANPSDGQRECVLSTQTQTALTWLANTGQFISGAPTALVAGVPACITYSASNLTWNLSP